jgi:hypothetical protein
MPGVRDYNVSYPGTQYLVDSSGNTTTITNAGARRGNRVSNDVRRLKPRGMWVPPTSYSVSELHEHQAYGNTRNWTKPWPGNPPLGETRTYGYLFNGFPNTAGMRSQQPFSARINEDASNDMATRTLAKARNRLKASNVNLGMAWAERRQVSSQILGTARDLASAFSALKKGRWKKCCKKLRIQQVKPVGRGLASQWLGYQYGWKPLLSDIHGSVLALEKAEKDNWMVTVKASSREKRTVYGREGADTYAAACIADHVQSRGCFVRIDAVPGNSAVATAASLGLTNPLQIAWELVPFSFVVDWFLPVGDYLNQFDSLLGWDIRGYSMSSFNKTDWKWTGINTQVDSGGYTWHYERNFVAKRQVMSLTRTASLTVPFPFFPVIKDPVSKGHVANALALLVQAFGR